MNWSRIDAYLDIDSLIDIDYARQLYAGCHLSQTSAYSWIEFIDLAGLDDYGDFYYHVTYPEINRAK